MNKVKKVHASHSHKQNNNEIEQKTHIEKFDIRDKKVYRSTQTHTKPIVSFEFYVKILKNFTCRHKHSHKVITYFPLVPFYRIVSITRYDI